jgi:hypothetical protein
MFDTVTKYKDSTRKERRNVVFIEWHQKNAVLGKVLPMIVGQSLSPFLFIYGYAMQQKLVDFFLMQVTCCVLRRTWLITYYFKFSTSVAGYVCVELADIYEENGSPS